MLDLNGQVTSFSIYLLITKWNIQVYRVSITIAKLVTNVRALN